MCIGFGEQQHGALQVDRHQSPLPGVDLAKQLLPGSFEYAVHHLFEHEIDLGGFAARYRND